MQNSPYFSTGSLAKYRPTSSILYFTDQWLLYTCQLFLTQRREIFILGVLGFSKTTRLYPKISEDVLNKYSQVLEKMIMLPYGPSKIRDFRESIVICSFYMDVSHIGLSLHVFGKCVSLGCNSSHFSTKCEKLFRKRELAFSTCRHKTHTQGMRVGRYIVVNFGRC